MGRVTRAAVANVAFKYVDAQRDRSGKVIYWYFRRGGRRWRLPDAPPSETFMDAYRRLIEQTEPGPQSDGPSDRRDYPPGTFGALVADYLASAGFKEKAPRTQAEYRRVLDALVAEKGAKPLNRLEKRHIRQMRDARADTPAAANTVLRMLKLVLNFAVDDGLIKVNPAAGMRELKVGEWRSWEDHECAAFEARWAPGTMQRRAYALALYTGQRRADLVAMTRAHRKDGMLHVVSQGKTGEELWIPEHRELTAELARGEQGHMSLLTTSKGKGFDPVYFGAWFAEAIGEAGLPDDCVLHGLRKTAARKLAEAGCSEDEIKAVTGHRTSRMVGHYTKAADKRKRATAAILKLENNK